MRLSDTIESFIKTMLTQEEPEVELKRNELAEYFGCAPSQINYVLATRFTIDDGYVIESRRGGGGYIRIARVSFSDQHQMFDNLMGSIGECISEQVFTDLIQLLFDEKIISEREGNLILATASDEVLGKDAPEIRARMLRKILQRLDRKGFHL